MDLADDRNRLFVATVVAAVGLLLASAGVAAYLSGTGAFDERPRVQPRITQFLATDAACDRAPTNVTAAGANRSGNSFVTLRGNLSVPDATTTLENRTATFERVGLANYTLSLASVDTGESANGSACAPDAPGPAVAFVITVQVPHSRSEPYGITVAHDGRTVAVVRNSPTSDGPQVTPRG